MRDIKFRGKRTGNGEWVYGYYMYKSTSPSPFIIIDIENGIEWRVDEKSVGQYIVTEDNQEIFEKDIIQEWKHDRLIRTFIAEDIRTFAREYDKSGHGSIYKVIGNKFENPELLEQR